MTIKEEVEIIISKWLKGLATQKNTSAATILRNKQIKNIILGKATYPLKKKKYEIDNYLCF